MFAVRQGYIEFDIKLVNFTNIYESYRMYILIWAQIFKVWHINNMF